MKNFCLLCSEPASLRLMTVRPASVKSFRFGSFISRMGSLALVLLALAWVAIPIAFAQDDHGQDGQGQNRQQEQTFGDAFTPLVYSVQNVGANFRAPNFPSFAQLPIIRPLPDPFRFFNGSRDTSFSSWERHRSEIMAAIEKYEIGPVPDCHDCTITANYVPPTAGSTTGRGTLTVNVTRNGVSLTLTSGVWLPSGMGSGPFPAVIGVGTVSSGPNYGSLPASVFAGLPIATVDFPLNQVTNDGTNTHTTDPFYLLYPELCAGTCAGTSNSGQYAAWSWGVSRIIDGIEIATKQAVNPIPIDMKHLAMTGCSYAGKLALFAGAFDERIALTIAQENGGGGAPSWRVSQEIESPGSVEDINDTNYNWFGGQMMQFAGSNVYKLPEDHDELMDLVAPRALLQTGNSNFYWLSNGSAYVSSRATQRVYNQFGIGDRFGFYIDGGHAHCATLPAENVVLLNWVNKFMLGHSADTDTEVYPNGPGQPTTPPSGDFFGTITYPDYPYYFPTMDYQRWTAWWGTDKPVLPGNWNTGGTLVLPLNGFPGFGDSVTINTGDTVMAGYDLLLGGNHPAATVSFEEGNVQTDVSCPDGSSYTLTVPLTSSQSYSIAAGNNSWVPSANQNSSLVYQGSTTATAPSGVSACVGGHTTDAYFTALGIQDGFAGDAAGPGIVSTDITDPLNLRFHVADTNTGTGGRWSAPVTVNFQPINCAAAPFSQQLDSNFPQNCPAP